MQAKIVNLDQDLAMTPTTAGSASNNCNGRPCSSQHAQTARISESCLSQPAEWTTTMKRREDNRTEFISMQW